MYALLILIALVSSAFAAETSWTGPKLLREYRGWTKSADQAALMPWELALLCRWLDLEKEPEGKNPHEPSYAQAWVNEAGRSEFFGKLNPRFPEGTVLVKEKLMAQDAKKPKLLTVMIKREASYNPDGGNWE